MILLSDRTCDYYFALCVVLLITFQFWYGAPHISFYENTEEMSKSHLYVGSSSMPAGWTIYMCAKEKTNNMSYDVSVIEKSKKVFTRTILGNASKMPIPTITKPPLGGILSYVLSKAQMEDLENNPQIEQVFVEPLMHCLEPVKFCSKNTKQHKLITNEIQCLAIANPNNYEVRVDFMVNFHVTNTQSQIDDGDDNKNINNDNYNNNDVNNITSMKSHDDQEIDHKEDQKEIIYETKIIDTKNSKIIINSAHSVFSVILKSSI
ncbi:unnamed protein product [Rhizophagus irregularis]|nr:unnamed protein product [Rhizophagus irregularis]CAB5319595.1 unnamed protein product [Rhizophagus irregularis]